MPQYPFDLEILIDGDHVVTDSLLEQLETGACDREPTVAELVDHLSRHLTAEEAVVAPAAELALGAVAEPVVTLLTEQLGEAHDLLDLLAETPTGEAADQAIGRLRVLLAAHDATTRRQLLHPLRVEIGDHGMAAAGEDYLDAKRGMAGRAEADRLSC